MYKYNIPKMFLILTFLKCFKFFEQVHIHLFLKKNIDTKRYIGMNPEVDWKNI